MAKSKRARSIRALVKELDELNRAYMAGEDDEDPNDPGQYKLYPPASAEQIAILDRKWKGRLPPSYQSFLALHNGWLGFWGGTALIGAPRKYNKAYRDDVTRNLKNYDGYLLEEDLLDPRLDTMLAKDILPIGSNLNGGLLAFDLSRVHKKEPEVIDCMHCNGLVDNRHKNFREFLEQQIACTRSGIKEQEKPRARVPRVPAKKPFHRKKREALWDKMEGLCGEHGNIYLPFGEFLDGNRDNLSLYNTPPTVTIAYLRKFLGRLKAKRSVQDCLVEVDTIGREDGEWPQGQSLYLLTSAPESEVHQWLAPLGKDGWADLIIRRTFKKDMEGPGVPKLRTGMRIYLFTWD